MKAYLKRYPPKSSESLPGYLLRLAGLGGFESLGKYLRANGAPLNIRTGIFDKALVTIAVKILEESAATVWRAFEDREIGSNLIREARICKNLELRRPRVCPQCIESSPYHRIVWQMAPIGACLLHGTPLLSQCPGCLTPLEWDAYLLTGTCASCCERWPKHSPPNIDLPDYLVDFQKRRSQNAKVAWLDDMLLTVQRVDRPFDTVFDLRARPPKSILDWNQKMIMAFQLLNSDTELWSQECRIHREHCKQLGTLGSLLPVKTHAEKLKLDWPAFRQDCRHKAETPAGLKTNVSFIGLAAFDWILPSRSKHYHPDSLDEGLRYQVNVHQLAELMGCKSGDISAFVERDVFEPLGQRRSMHNALFDLRHIQRKVLSGTREICGPLTSFSDLQRILPLYGCNALEVFIAMLAGDIPYTYEPNDKTVAAGLHVPTFTFARWVKQTMTAKSEHVLTLSESARFLGVRKSDVLFLAQNRLLQPAPWRRHEPHFSVGDLTSVIKTYRIDTRRARLRATTGKISEVRYASGRLAGQCFQPR